MTIAQFEATFPDEDACRVYLVASLAEGVVCRRCGNPDVSAEYMPLYVAEFQLRYSHRRNADIFGTGC